MTSSIIMKNNEDEDKLAAVHWPHLVLNSEVIKYKDKMDLDAKVTKIEEQIKFEEEREALAEKEKKEEEKKRLEAEKNDGVIRYAFGQKLGQVRPSKFDSITYFTLTENIERSPYFQNYYALTTPETNKVFSIYGVSDCTSAKKCKENAEKVMSILSAKYGQPLPHVPVESHSWLSTRKATDEAFLYFRRIQQDKHNRLIELICVTDANQIKQKRVEFKQDDCRLDENLFDESITKTYKKRHLNISKYNLYNQWPGDHGYSDYGNNIIPISIPGKIDFNTLYPAPMPYLSKSYNQNHRKCGLNKNNDIFRLFIRYSNIYLEDLIVSERKSIKQQKAKLERKKRLESSDANGL